MTLVALGFLLIGASARSEPRSVTIASEFPTTDQDPSVQIVVDGAVMALEDRGGKVCGGAWSVGLEQHSDATAQPGWDVHRAFADATLFAARKDIVAVIGTYNSGAAFEVIPILNAAGLVIVSPANTAPPLTAPDNPLYASGPRNYARICGNDSEQAPADLRWALALGATRGIVLRDTDADGYAARLASGFADAAVGHLGLAPTATYSGFGAVDADGLAATVLASGADAIFFADFASPGFVAILDALAAVGFSGIRLGPDGIMDDPRFLGPSSDGVRATIAAADPAGAPSDWAARFKARFGAAPVLYSLESYAAMQVILSALDGVCAAGGSPADRDAVRAAVMATSGVPSVLGPISFDPYGDRVDPEISGYQIRDDVWTFTDALH
jgi:branched-chain amino acid transport system substrate-binding protein